MRKRHALKNPLFHLVAATTLVLFTNCSGFSAKDLEQVRLASNAGGTTTPPTAPPTQQTTPPPPPPAQGMKRVFLASGHMARTTISCDDGQSWINDRSDNDSARCNIAGDPNQVECTHAAQAAINVDSGDGWLFTDYGWGAAGSVRKSRDGINWTVMRSDSWGSGVLYAAQKLILFWDSWYTSGDLGQTWANDTTSPPSISGDHPSTTRLGTKFFAIGRDNGMAISRDQGATWEMPSGFNTAWASTSVAQGNGLIVFIGSTFNNTTRVSSLYSARSTDDGRTWAVQLVDAASQYGGWEQMFFDGTEFKAFSAFAVWKSADGLTWTPTGLRSLTPNVNMWSNYGKIAFNPSTGTYVMSSNSYAQQSFSRSTDGINWTLLDPSKFKASHPINAMAYADIEARYCP